MPFSKGDPNINRAGRPKKGMSLKDLLRERVDELTERGTTRAEEIISMLSERAEDGDLKAIEMILDRLDGKPTQHIDSVNENKLIIEHEITD